MLGRRRGSTGTSYATPEQLLDAAEQLGPGALASADAWCFRYRKDVADLLTRLRGAEQQARLATESRATEVEQLLDALDVLVSTVGTTSDEAAAAESILFTYGRR